jgi:hypothetical protein
MMECIYADDSETICFKCKTKLTVAAKKEHDCIAVLTENARKNEVFKYYFIIYFYDLLILNLFNRKKSNYLKLI